MRDCRLHDSAPLLKEPPTQRRDSKNLPPGPLEQSAHYSTHTSRPSTQGPGWRTRSRRGGPRTVAGGVQTASPLRDAGTHHSELWHPASSADLPAATVTGDRGLSSLRTSRSLTREGYRSKMAGDRQRPQRKQRRPARRDQSVCLIGQISCCCIRLDRTSGLVRVTVDSTN